jgi:hypothetical protein
MLGIMTVCKTYNKGPKAAANSANCDLYEKLFDLIFSKDLIILVRWMPLHLKQGDELSVGVSLPDVIANGHADRLAKEAAASVQLSHANTSQYMHYSRLVSRLQKRLATILLYIPTRKTVRREEGA